MATRIVHENLPKFCDNSISFEKQETEYLNVYSFLKEKGNALRDKDNNPLHPITRDAFQIPHLR